MEMETSSIDKTCFFCSDQANGKIEKNEHSLELCKDCAKDVLWELIHNSYAFERE